MIQKKRFPERVLARDLVNQAKQRGELIPQPCKICGSYENLEAHHYKGYALENALEVEYYCRVHHREIEKTSDSMSDAKNCKP